MYLPGRASRARVREAENARRNRAEILKAWSQGQVSRRDLIKMGLFTAGGALAFKNGLSPFAPSAYGAVPTGFPRSPLFNVQAFTQPMHRFDVLPRKPVWALNPAPLAQVDETKRHLLDPRLEGVRPRDTGPNEGRPPGPIWAHQEFTRFAPVISIEATQEGAKANTVYKPGVTSNFNSGINATDPKAGGPNDAGGITKVPGDWHETMSTHWFHDHMFSFTAQNVYKGMAGMFNIYSALDRGNETINDGVNLRLPSGKLKSWGNLEYDINLMLADKAWDAHGQLAMDIFDFDGFLGDQMTVNLAYKPFFEVEQRKYRFRILNGAVSRFFKISLSDGSPMIQIANDGNLLPSPVVVTQLDQQGIAERYDIVIDFSRYSVGQKVWMVNLLEHENGTMPAGTVSLSQALSGSSRDPCVGKFLEFRIVRDPATPDVSQVPAVMIPNPDLSTVPVARQRNFVFGDDGNQTTDDPVTSFRGPWGIGTNGGDKLDADFGRISAAPRSGTRETGHLKN